MNHAFILPQGTYLSLPLFLLLLLLLLLFFFFSIGVCLPTSSKNAHLETVHLDLVLTGNAYLRQKLRHVVALITLQLHHLAIFCMLHHTSVTREFPLASLDQLLEVVVWRDALYCSQSLASATLLNTTRINGRE